MFSELRKPGLQRLPLAWGSFKAPRLHLIMYIFFFIEESSDYRVGPKSVYSCSRGNQDNNK